MLRIVTKEDFWAAEDDGFLNVPDWQYFSIKQIQDAVLLSLLRDATGLDILEVGGGKSRTLPTLCKRNRCTNVDPVEGMGHGPVGLMEKVPWRHVFRFMGDTTDVLPDSSFDIVYSISVIEHVGDPDVPKTFADMARVLRPSGRMIHLIDVYLGDFDGDNNEPRRRARLFRAAMAASGLAPASEMIPDEQIYFRGAYASNPDIIMNQWNKMAPSMRPTRSASQACTFLLEAVKAAD